MNKTLMQNGWIQKTVRISDDYHAVCKIIEFHATQKEWDIRTIYETIFSYSLDNLLKKGFHYDIELYERRREPKGFLVSEKTLNELNEQLENYKRISYKLIGRKLLGSEFYELLIYIYCINNLDSTELTFLKNKRIDFKIKELN